ncbi:MAG: methyltransferase domain-containing protein [Burkholderiaceae bacterium]
MAPEELDSLGADDPAARRSRSDLRRLHFAMGTLSIMTNALDTRVDASPLRILELGAGDGSLALRFARSRAAVLPNVTLTLLDRQPVVDDETLEGLRKTGWRPKVATADVFDWLDRSTEGPWDIIIANLFLHHFQDDELTRLVHAVAKSTATFFCCEPRRSSVALVGSHLVGLIGAGAVTRNDAVLSVHAGFRGQELSAHWPSHRGWSLREYSAGLFSHCLLARKV